MASSTQRSPILLSPRPGFLRVGWGWLGTLSDCFFLETIRTFFGLASRNAITTPGTEHCAADKDGKRDERKDDQQHGERKKRKAKQTASKDEEQLKSKTSSDTQNVIPSTKDTSATMNTYAVATMQDLFRTLEELEIAYNTKTYQPKESISEFVVENTYCKNLFLKDRKGQFYLVVCHEDEKVDLKSLKKQLKAYRNFSFGCKEDMQAILQVCPGGVTPFALMNSSAADVIVAVSHNLTVHEHGSLLFHPLNQEYATCISYADLVKFLTHFGHKVRYIN